MTATIEQSDQDRIDEAASHWVVLASDRELTASEQDELMAWRAESPNHDRAWRDFDRTWNEIPAMTGLGALVPIDTPSAASPPARLRDWKRYRAAGFMAAAAAVVAIIASPMIWPAGPQSYATEIAQSRLLTLPDGSQVTLGPKSRLTESFSDGERRVVLAGGEAFFEVVRDRSRPFLVQAGDSVVRVVGTKFDVNVNAASVRISVLEGLVEVRKPGGASKAPAAIQMLRAGERTEVLRASPISPSAGSAPPAASALSALPALAPGAWREGRLVYENARLADLVADVNRYYAPGVSLSDSAVGELRVTASFKASEIPAFLSALNNVVPVRSEEKAGGAVSLGPIKN